MLLNYIQKRQKMLEESNNFYTASGIHVFTKNKMVNDLVDLEGVIGKLESMLPDHIRDGVEMVIVGQFDEFQERGINAFYKDGALYVSNFQSDNDDLLDDLIHETFTQTKRSKTSFCEREYTSIMCFGIWDLNRLKKIS